MGNGLLIQWGDKKDTVACGYKLDFPLSFSSDESYFVNATLILKDTEDFLRIYNKTSKSFYVYESRGAPTHWQWFAIGF